ncbi:MAG: 30S ribosomal protein S1 [Proteobacteria bacterium]|nr:30S ribosomal protein S1 [Pseudomonadota bacterium]
MSEDFASMLDNTFSSETPVEGSVVKGIVVAIENDIVVIDIGMKAEGRVSVKEFIEHGKTEPSVKVGSEVEVYLDALDDQHGEANISREKAKREEALGLLEKAYEAQQRVTGIIFGRVKGGFTVDVQGALAFLPGSQVDIRPVRDMNPLMHTPLEFQILKMDRKRGNIIVSRRAIMDESRAEARDELLKDMTEGKVLEGVVKNITDYGAFIDMGGIDGLLHITDIAWHRISHPSEVLHVGQVIKVKVIRFNEETKRVSLGLKQLSDDPWSKVDAQFPLGAKVKGTVTNITDYGAFVELAPGIEGLIHVSEMSWTRKNVHPGKILSTSQEVEVMVLEIDREKRRISLGLKQCQANPWDAFAAAHPEGAEVEGVVRNITDFGIFIGLTEEIDGLIHMSDLAWDKSGEEALKEYKKGDTIKAKVLTIDIEKERISLGVKQLSDDPMAGKEGPKKGATVTAKVTEVTGEGLTVELEDGMTGTISLRDIARDRDQQNTSRFNVGDSVNAKVIKVDGRTRAATLSIKALEMAEEKEAVKAYAGGDEGAGSLGDVLADALGAAKKSAKKK